MQACPRCGAMMVKTRWAFSDKIGLMCPKCRFKFGKTIGRILARNYFDF